MEDIVNLTAVEKADVEKIHAEINQLRNQQFLICSFALAVFGSIPLVSAVYLFVYQLVLIILGILGLWFYVLLRTHSRLAEYLRTKEYSSWERDHMRYADMYEHSGQRKVAVYFFCTLATIIVVVGVLDISYFKKYGDIFFETKGIFWFISLLAVFIVYCSFLYKCLYEDSHFNELQKGFKRNWETVLEVTEATHDYPDEFVKMKMKVQSFKDREARYHFVIFILGILTMFLFFAAFGAR